MNLKGREDKQALIRKVLVEISSLWRKRNEDYSKNSGAKIKELRTMKQCLEGLEMKDKKKEEKLS